MALKRYATNARWLEKRGATIERVDIVVVTRAADAHLLRFFLASYESFWEGGGKLFLVTRRSDGYLWEQIPLPPNTRLIYREDFPELVEDDFRNHLYLKLIAHRFVESEYYLMADSDFLFVAPCSANAFFARRKPFGFFRRARPVWFFHAWTDRAASRWQAGSEAFVGESIGSQYMAEPQWVLSRTVAAQLCRRYDARRILEMNGVSEFVVYGWFAHRYFPNAYHWVDSSVDPSKQIGRPVNQVPPDYLRLDPRIKLDDFPDARFLVFWSHWVLAEAKMAEFLKEAQRRRPDRSHHFPSRDRIYPSIQLPAPVERLYSELRGVDSDGWVQDEVWFAVNRFEERILEITLEAPNGPVGGSYQVAMQPPESFQLDREVNRLAIAVDSESPRHPILLRFEPPGAPVRDATGRTLRARLTGLNIGESHGGL